MVARDAFIGAAIPRNSGSFAGRNLVCICASFSPPRGAVETLPRVSFVYATSEHFCVACLAILDEC